MCCGSSWRMPRPWFYALAMDDAMEDLVQPRCRDCLVVMRNYPAEWLCPSCGWTIPIDQSISPPVFTGPSVWGG